MSDESRPGSKFVLPTVATCRHRREVQQCDNGGEEAVCQLLLEITGAEEGRFGRVGEDACRACCQSFPPARDAWNPVIASLVYDVARRAAERGGVPGCNVQAAVALQREAEAALDVVYSPEARIVPARAVGSCCYLGEPAERSQKVGHDVERTCRHPAHGTTTLARCRRCRDWAASPLRSRWMTLEEMAPPPQERCGAPVRKWSVGVLTAPRREATLEWCLDSLVRAGWDDPHLFVDGTVRTPGAYEHLSVTWRERRVGAWPNYYLALAELVMRDPEADAYFLVQDDAVLYDRGDLRRFLEEMLWPGLTPSLVSLYCSQAYNLTEPGWHALSRSWLWGALAFVFPRDLAREFLSDPWVFRHRWEAPRTGHAQIDALVGDWLAARNLPVWFPNPSLVQHVGNTSSIWRDARNATLRRADWFAGDLETPFAHDASPADFPEDHFPCLPERNDNYRRRIAMGQERMRRSRVVICGLCRNVRHFLPRLAARMERLGEMFADYRVVLFENDSTDATLEFLHDWRDANDRVHVLSERLDQPRFPQIRSRRRATWMAAYRNRYREYAVSRFGDFDYAIVTDTDLAGGWSYDGIASTFGHDGWDVVGSYGLLRRNHGDGDEYVHFDAWAFRMLGHPQPHRNDEINALLFRRGEPLFPALSCFGGLAVYRMEALRAAEYGGSDNEHVVLHDRVARRGFGRLFLNPSQIVLYTPE